jgi:hypothetical protein
MTELNLSPGLIPAISLITYSIVNDHWRFIAIPNTLLYSFCQMMQLFLGDIGHHGILDPNGDCTNGIFTERQLITAFLALEFSLRLKEIDVNVIEC